MSSDEFWRIKNNKIYPHPVQRVPFEQRTPGPKYTMKILESEQVEGIKSKYPNREVDDFQVGDRVAVTMYVSLHKEKMEVSKGLVIHRTNTGPNGYFTIRNMKLGVAYEYSIPYWSPFVHKIENLGTTIETKKKSIKWIRKMDPKLYTVK